MNARLVGLFLAATLLSSISPAQERGTHFSKIFVVILENTNASAALKQPYLKKLKAQGAYLDQFYAVTHPSQPNYIAMTSAGTHGVRDDKNKDLNIQHLGDLLEEKGLTWRNYAEDFPGDCFTGASAKNYRRKHTPFISYMNVQKNPERCANIVNSAQLEQDIADGHLANYSLYVPDMNNDGHDTGVAFASKWLEEKFDPILKDERFMKDMLFVVTFDEAGFLGFNRIYTVLLGESVKPGTVSKTRYGLYDLLRTIEDNFGLGTLGGSDKGAKSFSGVWR